MNAVLKVLMWCGLGGGIGGFAGYRLGYRAAMNKADAILAEYDAKLQELFLTKVGEDMEKRAGNAINAIEEYRGHRMTDLESEAAILGDPKGLDEILSGIPTAELIGDFDGDKVVPIAQFSARPATEEEFERNEFHVQVSARPATDEEEAPEMDMTPPEMPGDIDDDGPHIAPTPIKVKQMLPVVITEEEFERNEWECEEEKLLFYELDEVLYNTTTQSIIEYPDNVLGVDTLFKFHEGPGDPKDTLYVVNETFGMRFRVDRIDDAFQDCVDGGVHPEDDEPDDDPSEVTDDGYWDDV